MCVLFPAKFKAEITTIKTYRIIQVSVLQSLLDQFVRSEALHFLIHTRIVKIHVEPDADKEKDKGGEKAK